jgi:ribosomal protein S18
MSFTLSQLKQAIQDYTENTETTFVNNLNNFIQSAEEQIFKSVSLEFFRKNQTTTFESGNQYLNVPTDFMAPFSLSFTKDGNKIFLDYKDVNFLQEFAPDDTATGTPRYYAFFDIDNFMVAPTPDDTYEVELHYYYRPNSLTIAGDSGTTWLSENAPQAMLYGSLMAAYIFMKGEQDVIQMYQQQFVEAMSRLKNFGEARENTDAYRAGLLRREPT